MCPGVLVFFWVGNFDARYFLGSKISGLCIFLGLQYEAPSDPPVMYTSSTPLGAALVVYLKKRTHLHFYIRYMWCAVCTYSFKVETKVESTRPVMNIILTFGFAEYLETKHHQREPSAKKR